MVARAALKPAEPLWTSGNRTSNPGVTGEVRSFAPRDQVQPSNDAPALKVVHVSDSDTVKQLAREFGERLNQAADDHPHAPAHNYGRLTWTQRELKDRYNEDFSLESVRRWFSGMMKPRSTATMKALAQLLEVDEAWLAMGRNVTVSVREQRARDATATGVANVLAGLIQIAGGAPAFPNADDQRAKKNGIELYAVIQGAQYSFQIALGRQEGDKVRFSVPIRSEQCFTIGALVVDGPGVLFCELPGELWAEQSVKKGASVELVVDKSEVERRRITSFANRL